MQQKLDAHKKKGSQELKESKDEVKLDGMDDKALPGEQKAKLCPNGFPRGSEEARKASEIHQLGTPCLARPHLSSLVAGELSKGRVEP